MRKDRGATGKGPINDAPFSTLETFLLMMSGINVEDDYNLDILADHVMSKEFNPDYRPGVLYEQATGYRLNVSQITLA